MTKRHENLKYLSLPIEGFNYNLSTLRMAVDSGRSPTYERTLMSTLAQRIIQLLQSGDGLTDREITDQLFAHGAAQQPVNQTCRQLESKGQIVRRRRQDGKLGNYIGGSIAPELSPAEMQSSLASGFLSEDSVKLNLKNWLESQGWLTQVRWSRERGIDIEAIKDGKRWIIEAKGGGSLNPMRVNYFLAILGEILQRMSDPEAKYSIALPDVRQFRNLWARLPELAKTRTGVTIIFVDVDGNIQEVGATTITRAI